MAPMLVRLAPWTVTSAPGLESQARRRLHRVEVPQRVLRPACIAAGVYKVRPFLSTSRPLVVFQMGVIGLFRSPSQVSLQTE